MSVTLTRIQTKSYRRGSISLISSSPPVLQSTRIFTLPSELILEILEIATAIDISNAPFALALVCKPISTLIDHILYRTVVLTSARNITLFFRTVTTKPTSFIRNHVKRISVTAAEHLHSHVKAQLVQILEACTGVQTMALTHRSHSDPIRLPSACPSELILESYVDLSQESTFTSATLDDKHNSLSSVTKLRICEPGSGWDSPSTSLRPFMTTLTHLHLCRRAFANEENDIEFLDDVRAFLRCAPKMELLAVSIFPSQFYETDSQSVTSSSIWAALEEMVKDDERLCILQGKYGSWMLEWKDPMTIACPAGPPDFWGQANRRTKKTLS